MTSFQIFLSHFKTIKNMNYISHDLKKKITFFGNKYKNVQSNIKIVEINYEK